MKNDTISTRTNYGALFGDAARRAARYADSLESRRVCASTDAFERLDRLVGSVVPEDGCAPAAVLAELDTLAAPATVASAGPRYFGFVTGGALPSAVAASMLASAWDQNAFSTASSPAGAKLEAIVLGWLTDVLGLPSDCSAALTTGATLANFSALAAARHALLAREGWDVEARGLYGAPEVRIVVGAEVHPSLRKGLGMLGFGRTRTLELEVDAQGCIRADALPKLDGPTIVCAQAGNVNSGGSDPFLALREWCDEFDGWLHIDGAFGLWAAAAPERKHLVRGVECADSWATDGHKWLNVPYDSGIAFVRDGAALSDAMAISSAYLPGASQQREPFHTSPECSRRARGIELYATLRELGRVGVADLVERCCRLASRFADALEAAGYEVLNEVVLNQVVVAFGDEACTEATIRRIQQEGVCWCGVTRWRGRAAMRISVSNWSTAERHVDASLESILRCARAAQRGRIGDRDEVA
jgi:glutamate/tyrosine decarboxylase-like PLP-dependent enzyme